MAVCRYESRTFTSWQLPPKGRRADVCFPCRYIETFLNIVNLRDRERFLSHTLYQISLYIHTVLAKRVQISSKNVSLYCITSQQSVWASVSGFLVAIRQLTFWTLLRCGTGMRLHSCAPARSGWKRCFWNQIFTFNIFLFNPRANNFDPTHPHGYGGPQVPTFTQFSPHLFSKEVWCEFGGGKCRLNFLEKVWCELGEGWHLWATVHGDVTLFAKPTAGEKKFLNKIFRLLGCRFFRF